MELHKLGAEITWSCWQCDGRNHMHGQACDFRGAVWRWHFRVAPRRFRFTQVASTPKCLAVPSRCAHWASRAKTRKRSFVEGRNCQAPPRVKEQLTELLIASVQLAGPGWSTKGKEPPRCGISRVGPRPTRLIGQQSRPAMFTLQILPAHQEIHCTTVRCRPL